MLNDPGSSPSGCSKGCDDSMEAHTHQHMHSVSYSVSCPISALQPLLPSSKTQLSEGMSPSFLCSNKQDPQNSQRKTYSDSLLPPPSSSHHSSRELCTTQGSLQHCCTRADGNTLHGSAEPSLQLFVASLPNPLTLLMLGQGFLKSTLTLQTGLSLFGSSSSQEHTMHLCDKLKVITWKHQARESKKTTDTCHTILFISPSAHRKLFLLPFFFLF